MTSTVATVNGIRMHYVSEGSGPLVVLLHGWPQTWYEWRRLIPPLARRFQVVAPDLRGYGRTDKPASGYDKRTMAADVRGLIEHLGHRRAALVGHDRGARVAHRFGLDHPEMAERLALLDILPTRELFRRLDSRLARGFWHWLFHMQPDLPELLAGPQIEPYLRWFFERWTLNRPGLEGEAIDEYVRAYSAPGALRAGFDDYRATDRDLEDDDASFAAGRRLEMPVLALWGAAGLIGSVTAPLEIWREYAPQVSGEAVAGCGHFLPEERPEAVLERLLAFLDPEPGVATRS